MRKATRSAVVLVLATAAACTADAPPAPPTAPAPTAPTDEPSPSSAPAVRRWTRVAASPDGTLLVRGRYPVAASSCVGAEAPMLLARYPGALRVRLAEDGSLTATVLVPFDRYLEGIAEVPSSWPAAALEAQAIAARSYALATTGWSGEEGETLDEPICATTSCQVYRGIPVPRDPGHRRWIRAVRRTDGLVLLHGDRPATTVYFSTSNGRTYGNEDVFGSDPLPYLRPVIERDDGASPTSRWSVRVPSRDLRRFLGRADLWPRRRPIRSIDPGTDTVLVRGGGARRTIAVGELQDAINTWASCLVPRRYPPGRLPVTIPSSWSRLSVDGNALLVSGRGWGHGAGMVQWGAYGKARRGWSAAEILAFYYGGLRPEAFPEPGTIRVVVATGLSRLVVVPSGVDARLDGEPFEGRRIVIEPTGDGLTVRT